MTNSVLSVIQIQRLQDPEFLTQLTLDASALSHLRDFNLEQLGSLELYTMENIFKTHGRRIAALKQLVE